MRFIYKIVCDDLPDFIYIGSTCNMVQRKYHHKSNSKDKPQKLYTTIRESGGWDNWRMVLVEELGDVSKNEAFIREEHYRVEFQANLNMFRCYITEEQVKENKKKYREDNRENTKEYNKEYNKKYYEEKKECYKKYYEENKEHIKEKGKKHYKKYYENNKVKFAEKNRKYYEKKKLEK